MNIDLYNNLVSFIREHKGLSHDCMKALIRRFPEQNYDTLNSILMTEYQKRMKLNHIKIQTNKAQYLDLYQKAVENCESPGIILRMAKHFDIAPCLIAKLILAQFFEQQGSDEQNNVNVYLRDTTLLEDMDLSYEILLCTLYDNIYSPITEAVRGSLGQQYEVKLYKKVKELNLAFRDEEYLRKQGYDKTPDCKLDVPIVVDGFIVNWIESKALFGDKEVHRDYMKNQYLSYWNRFGPGLVIYWFGYLETIVEPNDKRFIIRDSFPDSVICMPPPNFELENFNELTT
nr:unnamed protein product [Callosobruchus analis]